MFVRELRNLLIVTRAGLGMLSIRYINPHFSRIRTRQADIRDASLRPSGYQKGKYKKEGPNFKLLSRTTDPQTVYRKDALNRDDIIDITDFEVADYQYRVMRRDLNEEIATAIMIGDGREEGDEAKIYGDKIRPIWLDDEIYTIHTDIDLDAAKAELQGSDTGKHFGENYIRAEAVISTSYIPGNSTEVPALWNFTVRRIRSM